MRYQQNLNFFINFKEKNRSIYEKIKKILYNFKNDSIIYFDQIDNEINDILSKYDLIEKQILIKELLFELDPLLVKNYEIFPFKSIRKLETLNSNTNQKDQYVYSQPKKTTLEVLNQIEKSVGILNLFN